jgi:serine/threonine-protein kinase
VDVDGPERDTLEPGSEDINPSNDAAADFTAGQRVGPYLLEKRLGSGGMGEVWLATRTDGSLNRQIALKLPHIHLFAATVRRRFERERDILAALSHPHIAQLYDAGVDSAQHPYLAMEWVDGVSIVEHCRTERLPLERRLALFLQVLEAVGYAHRRLVAHRDLKPSNILVTRDGRVKLLDFGIAKLLRGDTEGEATQLTLIGSCIATPGYAAPEQLTGAPATVAVDVYALGVILHELLTGTRPPRRDPLAHETTDDAVRASSRIDPGHAAELGGLAARELRRALAGDLDAIIGKALARDPDRRYSSAEAFAQDLELSRQHRPISARHISAATIAIKFVRRHLIGVAMALGLLAALIAGSAGIAWQGVRAEREARRATAIKDFLVGVFRASDPRIAADKPRGEVTARELLDISSQRIETSFAQQPETQVELLGVTADIYRELDETQRSNALYARETELAEQRLGPADPRTIEGLLGQAYNADADGDDAKALEFLAEADPLIRRRDLDDSEVRARWLLMQGEALYRDPAKTAEAQSALQAAAALFAQVAPRDPLYPGALTDLGTLSYDRSDFTASAKYFRLAIAAAQSDQRMTGDVLLANQGLALTLRSLGDAPGASQAFEAGTKVAEKTYGLDNRQYWMIASDWAQFLYDTGERLPAFAKFEALVGRLPRETQAYRNASDSLEAALVLRKYGRCLAIDGQGDKAVEYLERARALFQESAQHPPDAAMLLLDLGNAYEADGKMTEAQAAFLDAIHTLESQQAPASWIASAHERRGRFLLAQDELPAAAIEFGETLRLMGSHTTAATILARAGLGLVAVRRADSRAALDESGLAMDQLEKFTEIVDVRIGPYVWGVRARALQLAGDGDSAIKLAQRSRDASLVYYAPGSPAISRAKALLQSTSTRTASP